MNTSETISDVLSRIKSLAGLSGEEAFALAQYIEKRPGTELLDALYHEGDYGILVNELNREGKSIKVFLYYGSTDLDTLEDTEGRKGRRTLGVIAVPLESFSSKTPDSVQNIIQG